MLGLQGTFVFFAETLLYSIMRKHFLNVKGKYLQELTFSFKHDNTYAKHRCL